MAENKLKLKKLERELGLQPSKNAAQNIDIPALIAKYVGGEGESESENPGGIEGLIQGFIENNPELVQKLASKYLGSSGGENAEGATIFES